MIFSEELLILAKELINLSLRKNLKISTIESCTGGLTASLITSISGSSQVFDCGLVTYSNESKNKLLGITNELLEKFGAVSEEVANAMAISMTKSNANLTVSITGIAGPNSDKSTKKVGLVFISSFNKNNNKLLSRKFEFKGNREEIRSLSVKNAILILIEQIKNNEIN